MMVRPLVTAILCLAALQYVAKGDEPSRLCRQRYTKVGCYRDKIVPDRPFKEQLLNRIDKHSKKNDGVFINSDNYPESLYQLVCKCNELASAKGYTHFGIQLYGECWAGDSSEYLRDGVSTECVNNTMAACNDNSPTECAGKCGANYIYKVNRQTDGGWSAWTTWSSCIGKCGNIGKMNRTRTCTKPRPAHGGKPCMGKSAEIDDCKAVPCPSWATWGSWSQCLSTRQRECVIEGQAVEDRLCGTVRQKIKECKKCQGDWGSWGNWGACVSSVPCGPGKKKRSRNCLPFPSYVCDGAKVQETTCQNKCQKTWTQWEAWSSCSKTCGGGTRLRSRRCIAVGTKYVVSGCTGSGSQSSNCNTRGCPVWGHYGSWGPCSVTCGTGSRTRNMFCVIAGTTTPTGGCEGTAPSQAGSCSLPGCPVWTGWSEWSPCKRCRNPNEIVQQSRTRRCVHQKTTTATSGCSGQAKETKNCIIPYCSGPSCSYKCVPTDFEGQVCVRYSNGRTQTMVNECAFKTARKCATPGITMRRGKCLTFPNGGGGGFPNGGGGGITNAQ